MKGQIWTIGLVAILASLVGAMVVVVMTGPGPVHAQTASSSNDVQIVTGNTRSESQDVLYVINTRADRLLVYELRGRSLTLAAARYIEFDLQLDEWPKKSQEPGVKKVYKDTKDKADPPSGTRKLLAVTGNYQSDTRDLLYIYDTRSQRMVIYEYNNGRLSIVAARNTRYDLKLDEWRPGQQTPSVKSVRKMVKGEGEEAGGN